MITPDLLDLCDGNVDAVSLIVESRNLCEVWDDAIDGESKESPENINRAFQWALFGFEDNPFYQSHPELRSALQVAIANWLTANALEKSGDPEKLFTAYTLRCSPYDFFVSVVLAAAGPVNALKAALAFRTEASPDRLDNYLEEHLGVSHHGMGTKRTAAA